MANALTERAAAIEARAFELAREAVDAGQAWVGALGAPPSGQVEALTWRQAAATVAAYRDRWSVDGSSPLGAETSVTSLEMLAQRRRAMAAVRRASVLARTAARPSAGPRLRAGRPAPRRPPSRRRWWERHGEVGAVTRRTGSDNKPLRMPAAWPWTRTTVDVRAPCPTGWAWCWARANWPGPRWRRGSTTRRRAHRYRHRPRGQPPGVAVTGHLSASRRGAGSRPSPRLAMGARGGVPGRLGATVPDLAATDPDYLLGPDAGCSP